MLLFENAPVWILGLYPTKIQKIYIPQFNSFSDLLQHILGKGIDAAIYNKYVSLVGRRYFFFGKQRENVSYFLISGSTFFLNDQLNELRREKVLYISDQHKVFRRLPNMDIELRRVSHSECGGATTFTLLLGHNFPFQFGPSTLTRKIGDFIDHGVLTKDMTVWVSRHVPEDTLYPVSTAPFEVKYATRRVKQGWACRPLSPKELGDLYGFDCDLTHDQLKYVVPRTILTRLISLLGNTRSSRSLERLNPRPLPPGHRVTNQTWIPALNKNLPHLWCEGKSTSTSVKHDDAATQTSIWDLRITPIFPSFTPAVLDQLRALALRYCRRALLRSFICYLKTSHPMCWKLYVVARAHNNKGGVRERRGTEGRGRGTEGRGTSSSKRPSPSFLRDLIQGRQVLWSYVNSTFFEWDCGSTIIFWRWPKPFIQNARDGIRPYFTGPLPSNQMSPRPPAAEHKEVTWKKFQKALKRCYLQFCPASAVKSFVDYFQIPKGLTDIRMVLNGTSSGLNSAVFTPNFWLPYSPTMTRLLHYDYRYVDLDVGECFLNFGIHKGLIPYSGMDLTCFKKQIKRDFPDMPFLEDKRLAAVWTRTWFGFRQSPEVSFIFHHLAEEIIRGDRRDKNNALRFDRIIINAIGDKRYNPALPNVFKYDEVHKRIAGDLIAYVDDLRTLGYSLEEAWRIARQVMSRLQYLGMQDAARKRRIGDGPWAGGVYTTTHGKIQKTVTKEKWKKGRNLLLELNDEHIKEPTRTYCYKRLEKIRGFFCHLSMVFSSFAPYLKGFHLTLAQHLPQRDDGGWKLSDSEWLGYVNAKMEEGVFSEKEGDLLVRGMENEVGPTAPAQVTPVKRFWECLHVLLDFMEPEIPPQILVRSKNSLLVVYGFADASGSGFGSSILIHGEVRYRIGTWGSDENDNSSNWRELGNLVESMEKAGKQGWLSGATVLLATDNEVAERALYKGNSSDEKLFGLVVRMKKLELKYGCVLLITHVAGTRMIDQGTDGISRGRMDKGVACGQRMLEHCPWGKTALEVSSKLYGTLNYWCGKKFKILSPEDWYEAGHDIRGWENVHNGIKHPIVETGSYIWCPPPAAADACIEQLRVARGKRKKSWHVIVIPRLMTPVWLKGLNKVADLTFEISPVHDFWSADLHEKLVVAFIFPFLPFRPWQLRSTPKMLSMGRELRKVFKTKEMAGGKLLRKLLLEIKGLPCMPSRMVWRLLFFGERLKFPISLQTDAQEKGHSGKRRRGESGQSSGVGKKSKTVK